MALIPAHFLFTTGVSALPQKTRHSNKKAGDSFRIKNFKQPPDSDRRETFGALIPAYFPFTGVSDFPLNFCHKTQASWRLFQN